MARAVLDGSRIVLETEWRERELCKTVPGCRWDGDARTWWVTLSWSSCVALRGVFAERLEIDDALNNWAAAEIESRVGPCMSLRHATDSSENLHRGSDLEPMQRVGVEFLTTAKRALCGDGMGCITGDAIIHLNRAGKGFKMRLDDAYEHFNGLRGRWSDKVETRARALVDGQLLQHRVVDIVDKGVRETVTIEFESGKSLTATIDHPIARPNGSWTAAADLRHGDTVIGNGVDECLTLETVVSVKSAGQQRVYDMEMDGPHHNFVANGIVVHNSGKTIEAISTVETLALQGHDVFPCLVVCTNTMCWPWKDELEKWTGRSVTVLKGGKQTRIKAIEAGAAYLVINWEGLLGHTRLAGYRSVRLDDKDKELKELNAAGIKTVVADEAHRGKNPKAKQTRAWWYLSHHADFSFALTGTPVVKSPEDLWSIMHGICPEEWPSKTAWVDRYGLISWNPWGGMSVVGLRGDTQEELFKFLDPRFIRRPTQVVVPDIAEKLPPQVREIDMSPKQAKAYKQMRDDMLAQIDNGLAVETSQLTQTIRLVQLASAFAEVPEDNPDGFLMADPSNKIDALLDVIDELDGDPLVVFAQHKQLINLASKRLDRLKIEHGLITGDVSELERAQAVARFQSGELPVIMCTLAAGGEGITLTRARHVLFLQRSWSLKDNMQATDRIWRRGQDRPVQPIILVTRGTIEERVMALGEQRELTFEQVVRDQATLRKLLS